MKKTSRPSFLAAIVAGRKKKRTTNTPIEFLARQKIFCLKNQFTVLDKFVAISIISQRRTIKPVFLNERKQTNRVRPVLNVDMVCFLGSFYSPTIKLLGFHFNAQRTVRYAFCRSRPSTKTVWIVPHKFHLVQKIYCTIPHKYTVVWKFLYD